MKYSSLRLDTTLFNVGERPRAQVAAGTTTMVENQIASRRTVSCRTVGIPSAFQIWFVAQAPPMTQKRVMAANLALFINIGLYRRCSLCIFGSYSESISCWTREFRLVVTCAVATVLMTVKVITTRNQTLLKKGVHYVVC